MIMVVFAKEHVKTVRADPQEMLYVKVKDKMYS
jgi:hypothetical protein